MTQYFDGADEIIYSNSFNIYEGHLRIKALEEFDFDFIFENDEPKEGAPDIAFKQKEDKIIEVSFTKKIRNKLGANTTNKLPLVTFPDGRKILATVFCHAIGSNNSLHVTVTFYRRN